MYSDFYLLLLLFSRMDMKSHEKSSHHQPNDSRHFLLLLFINFKFTLFFIRHFLFGQGSGLRFESLSIHSFVLFVFLSLHDLYSHVVAALICLTTTATLFINPQKGGERVQGFVAARHVHSRRAMHSSRMKSDPIVNSTHVCVAFFESRKSSSCAKTTLTPKRHLIALMQHQLMEVPVNINPVIELR